MSLEDELKSWTDPDVAAYVLGNALGLFPSKTFLEVKGTFWTKNHLGNFLQGLLEHLSLLGILEHDEREQKFRWRGSFNESDGLAEPDYLYSGPPKDADVKMSLGKEGFWLEANRPGFRYIAQMFSDIASIPFEDGLAYSPGRQFPEHRTFKAAFVPASKRR